MAESQFVYVTYIRTTPEKLWQALIEPEFTRRYWMATTHESEWKPGAPWRIVFADGRTADSGEIVEIEPPRRLVLKWRHEIIPALTAEGYSRMTYELEPAAETVKLTLTHEMDVKDSKFIKAVSSGWPIILSSLKSLLETGESIEFTRCSPKGM
jgi:uncharacterized protein YndB with AHSA1/START domain